MFFPLAWGLGAPPPVTKGRAGGNKDCCLIATLLVKKVSRSLNSYFGTYRNPHSMSCLTMRRRLGPPPFRNSGLYTRSIE